MRNRSDNRKPATEAGESEMGHDPKGEGESRKGVYRIDATNVCKEFE